MNSIEVTAKKVEAAIKEGLEKLNATIDDVNVEILSQGGLFKKAKVRLTLSEEDSKQQKAETKEKTAAVAQDKEKSAARPAAKEPAGQKAAEKPAALKYEKQEQPRSDAANKKQPKPARAEAESAAAQPKQEKAKSAKQSGAAHEKSAADKAEKTVRADNRRADNSADITREIVEAAENFLKETARLMGVETGIRSEIDGKKLKIELITDDSAVIGYRGEALDALEYLASLVAGRGEERYVRLRLDCNGYRVKREESLVALARRMADKCAKNGKKVTLEPMSSAHRRIIHAALTDDDRVVTKSEGREPSRRVVILPKKK